MFIQIQEKEFSPRMNTNEHEYYLRSRMLFGCHFLASIREDSRSFVAKNISPLRAWRNRIR